MVNSRTADGPIARDPLNYLAFLGFAAALCCYKRYVRLTTQDGQEGAWGA